MPLETLAAKANTKRDAYSACTTQMSNPNTTLTLCFVVLDFLARQFRLLSGNLKKTNFKPNDFDGGIFKRLTQSEKRPKFTEYDSCILRAGGKGQYSHSLFCA